MYININDPDGDKDRNIPQAISSLILGISASLLIFGLIFLIAFGAITNSANGSESILSMLTIFWIPVLLITLLIAILVGLVFARIIYKKRTALVHKNTPAAHNKEISLYILSGLLLFVVCCVSAVVFLIATG